MNELEQLIFVSRSYAELNGRADDYRQMLISDERGPVVRWSGILDGSTLSSGFSAPFGGPDVRESVLRPSALHDAVSRLLIWSKEQGVLRLRLQLRPLYGLAENLVLQALLHHGFEVTAAEINHHVPLSGLATADSYMASLQRSPRKALRRCIARGDDYFEIAPESWKEPYDLLLVNRATKGRTLQLSLDYLLSAREHFGEKIRVVGLRTEAKLVAAALLYEVLPTVVVVVYWGDAGHELTPSPMHSLVAGITVEAAERGVHHLDLGISSVMGDPDDGLDQFKRTMLAVTSPRLVLQRDLL